MGRLKNREDIGKHKGKGRKKKGIKRTLKMVTNASKRVLKDALLEEVKSRRAKKREKLLKAREKLKLEKAAESKPLSNGFTDENKSWLKPKRKRVSFSGKNSVRSFSVEDEDNTDEDDNEMLEIEKQAIKRIKKSKNLNDEEDDDNAVDEKLEESKLTVDDLNATDEVSVEDLKQRIADTVEALGDFKNRSEAGIRRKSVLARLKSDLMKLYDYNEFLIDQFMNLFTYRDIVSFLEANESPRPITIRTNTIQTSRRNLAQSLINRGINLDPLGNWNKVGLIVYSSQVPLGATPEYLAGHYVIQGASSMIPVMALAPRPGEKILDLCAAPGMKTSQIGQMLNNTGTVVANDVNPERVRAIMGNIQRACITNVVITCMDGALMPQHSNNFHRVLVDAPCSGTGIISKDPSVKSSKSNKDIQRCFTLQRKLLLAAIDSCTVSKGSGYVVYSTCSILIEENEDVIEYALRKRDCKIVPLGVDQGVNGFLSYRGKKFTADMKHARRLYPHTHNMDGFFICKLQKLSNAKKTVKKPDLSDDSTSESDENSESNENLT